METQNPDDLARLFSGVSVRDFIPVSDVVLLEALNQLRHFEKRPELSVLPTPLQLLEPQQKAQWFHRFKVEAKTLQEILTAEIKQPHLILNKTELQLISLNRTALQDNPNAEHINSLLYTEVDPDDLAFYYPTTSNKEVKAFVTDSDVRLIGTPTYVSPGSCYIAPHRLDVTFSTLGQALPYVPPIVNRTSTPENQSYTDSVKSDSSISSGNSSVLGIPHKPKMNPPDKTVEELLKESLEREKRLKEKVKGAEAQAKSRIVELEDEIASVTRKLQTTQLRDAKEKPKARSEREEISDLKRYINMMVKKVESNLGFEMNTTVEEKQLVEQLRDDAEDDSPKMTYRLHFPDNILDPDIKRDPTDLPALKHSAVVNSIGIFDIDTNPNANFRSTWDTIIAHTKNYDLYEHEYISCLRFVIKGSAAESFKTVIRITDGDLKRTLEYLQDLFVPQTTFYEEYDELSHFVRKKGEHIRTTVSRISLAIFPLKETVTAAAWPDRRYNLIKQMVNQVIDYKTQRHLRMEDTKCLHTGSQLSIEAIINIIALYENTHDLRPTSEIKMKYNVNTMMPVDTPASPSSDLEEVKSKIDSLTHDIKTLTQLSNKRPRLDNPGNPNNNRPIAKAKRQIDGTQRMDTTPPKQNTPQIQQTTPPKQVSNTPATDLNKYQPPLIAGQQQTPQYPNQFGPLQQPTPTYGFGPQPYTQPYPQQQQYGYQGGYQNYNQRGYYGNGRRYGRNRYRGRGGRGNYDRNQYNQKGTSQNTGDREGQSTQPALTYNNIPATNTPQTYRFKHNDANILLKFYQCQICPELHQEGVNCPTKSENPQNQLNQP